MIAATIDCRQSRFTQSQQQGILTSAMLASGRGAIPLPRFDFA
jgi:hypothetical protein